MRFRGGGVGHEYMRAIEPWLDSTGWGASWPVLEDRDPEPDDNVGGSQQEVGSNTSNDGREPEAEGVNTSKEYSKGLGDVGEVRDLEDETEVVRNVQDDDMNRDERLWHAVRNQAGEDGNPSGSDSDNDSGEDEIEDVGDEDLENPTEEDEILDWSSDEEHGEEEANGESDGSGGSEDESDGSNEEETSDEDDG